MKDLTGLSYGELLTVRDKINDCINNWNEENEKFEQDELIKKFKTKYGEICWNELKIIFRKCLSYKKVTLDNIPLKTIITMRAVTSKTNFEYRINYDNASNIHSVIYKSLKDKHLKEINLFLNEIQKYINDIKIKYTINGSDYESIFYLLLGEIEREDLVIKDIIE